MMRLGLAFGGRQVVYAATLIAICRLPVAAVADEPTAAGLNGVERVVFEDHVAPILRVYCWSCHGGGNLAGQLDLRNRPLILRGGKSGPAIVAGDAEKSLLYQKLVAGAMPPDKPIEENVVYSPLKLSAAHIQLVKRWIDGGAQARYTQRELNEDEDPPLSEDERSWWAFQSPRRPPLPTVRAIGRVRTPIDAFLLQQLERRKLGFSPDTERGTWLRRLHLDVTGLPPTAAAVERFVADRDPAAFVRQVDQLLASPAFGERWGRRWLDAAGYVDVAGRDNDAATINLSPGRWRYRDYVVDAFNYDLPFDQFVTEQLAGDELVDWRAAERFTPTMRRRLIATGFLRQVADSSNSKELNTSDVRTAVLLDTVQIVGTSLLGVTLHCAQCHTHKFDPIRHADYYRFAAIFAPALNVQNWKPPNKRFLWDVSSREKKAIDSHNKQVDGEIAKLKQRIAELRRPFREVVTRAKHAKIPEAIRGDVVKAVAVPQAKRNEIQKYLAERLGSLTTVSEAEVDAAVDEQTRRAVAKHVAEIGRLAASKRTYSEVQALWEFSRPSPFYLFLRGEFEKPGPPVVPAVLAVADRGATPFRIPPPSADATSSGYRLALARWLTRPDHPLLARVFVNRTWQHYFGRGIVATPDNFGASGAAPSHPELLDWLATEFIRSGFSVKHLHRTIVLSTAYRQSSSSRIAPRRRPNPHEVDSDNELLWRMPLRRLESEIIRDRMLAASGALNRKQGGAPIPLSPQPDSRVELARGKLADKSDAYRRSIYITARRNYHLTELNVFDQPLLSHNCTRRDRSAVVLQSLNMLNGKFAFEQAGFLAERVAAKTRASGRDAGNGALVRIAFRCALAREPTPDETTLCTEFLADQKRRHAESGPQTAGHAALKNLCQMLLNTNEFLYIH